MGSMNAKPAITVMMPVYNAEKYLQEAMDSILNQTFREFEFLIINDGSTDSSENIILSYNDNRIRYIKNEENAGLIYTLNKAVDLTKTKYFARMDADDIALPERLKVQYEFMEKNEHIGVCGTLFEIFGQENENPPIPVKDEEIKATLLFSNPICHPAVVIRTEILKKENITYGVLFDYADNQKILELEDYALWHQLKYITKFANIPSMLLKYRREGQNLTSYKTGLILERKKKFYTYVVKELNVQPSEFNLLLHISFHNIRLSKSHEDVQQFKNYLEELKKANKNINIYPEQAMAKEIEQRWENFFYFLPSMGYRYVKEYWKTSQTIQYTHLRFYLSYVKRIWMNRNKEKIDHN